MAFDFSRSQFNDKISPYKSFIEGNEVDNEQIQSFEDARGSILESQTDKFGDQIPEPSFTEDYAGSANAPPIEDNKPENTRLNLMVSLVDRSHNELTSRVDFLQARRRRVKIYREDAQHIASDHKVGRDLLDDLASLEVNNERPQ